MLENNWKFLVSKRKTANSFFFFFWQKFYVQHLNILEVNYVKKTHKEGRMNWKTNNLPNVVFGRKWLVIRDIDSESLRILLTTDHVFWKLVLCNFSNYSDQSRTYFKMLIFVNLLDYILETLATFIPILYVLHDHRLFFPYYFWYRPVFPYGYWHTIYDLAERIWKCHCSQLCNFFSFQIYW